MYGCILQQSKHVSRVWYEIVSYMHSVYGFSCDNCWGTCLQCGMLGHVFLPFVGECPYVARTSAVEV